MPLLAPRRRAAVWSVALVCAGVAGLASVVLARGQAPQAPAAPTGPFAPEKYKNIQVLTDVPADQLVTTMQYFTQATGLRCQSCHVADATTHVFAYEKDDNRTKQTARQMISMVKAVNAGNFGVRIECATCHAGHNRPAALTMALPLTDEQVAALAAAAARQGGAGRGTPPAGGPPAGAPGRGQAPAGPAVDDVLAKYVEAIGGPAAVAALQSVSLTGTLVTRERQSATVTVEEKGAKYRRTNPAGGESIGFDGTAGWLANGTTVTDLSGYPLWSVMRAATLALPLHAKERYQLQSGRPGPLAGSTAQVNVLRGPALQGGAPVPTVTETFSFDATSGLLLRRTLAITTPMGRIQEQTDYADYRPVGGVKLPFSIVVSTPQTLDTFTVADAKANPAIDDARFARPRGQ